jgi:hypothetical protein
MAEIRRLIQVTRLLLKALCGTLAHLYLDVSRDDVRVGFRFRWTDQATFSCWIPNRFERMSTIHHLG